MQRIIECKISQSSFQISQGGSMVNNKRELYWLNIALNSFDESVWKSGLQKFANDSEGEETTLEFGVLSIQLLQRTSLDSQVIVLTDGLVKVTLSVNPDEDNPEFQIETYDDLKLSTEMIYEILDSWEAGFFTIKES